MFDLDIDVWILSLSLDIVFEVEFGNSIQAGPDVSSWPRLVWICEINWRFEIDLSNSKLQSQVQLA